MIQPVLQGKTFISRFVEFMSFDLANTVASTYFSVMYGILDGVVSVIKYVIEEAIVKTRYTRAYANYFEVH